MIDENFLKNWISFRLITADDQHIAINQTNGEACAFRCDDPKKEGWYHWMIVPTPDGRRYWIFNRLAQDGSGECLSLPQGKAVFGQWAFTGEPRQTFELRQQGNDQVTLICEDNHEALSTRWNEHTFTWKYDPKDDRQKLEISTVEALPLPDLPMIEGEPGALDRELLQVESFEGGLIRETPPRVVGTELIAFTGVRDGQPIGDQMNYSPYYLLVRECYWKRSFDEEYSGAGGNEMIFEWEVGIKTTSVTSIEEVINVEVGVGASYKLGKKSGPGWERGISVAFSYGKTWTKTDSIERYEGQKGTSIRRFKEGKRVRVGCWHLVNVYTIKHLSGDVVGQIKSIEPTISVERAFPPAEAPTMASEAIVTHSDVSA